MVHLLVSTIIDAFGDIDGHKRSTNFVRCIWSCVVPGQSVMPRAVSGLQLDWNGIPQRLLLIRKQFIDSWPVAFERHRRELTAEDPAQRADRHHRAPYLAHLIRPANGPHRRISTPGRRTRKVPAPIRPWSLPGELDATCAVSPLPEQQYYFRNWYLAEVRTWCGSRI